MVNNPNSRGAHNIAIAFAISASMAFGLYALTVIPGCGGTDLDVDKAALYTPESLAAEFAFGFKALSSETKATARKIKPRVDKNRGKGVLSENAVKKGKRVGTPKKTVPKGPPTLEELVEDVDKKIDLIKGVSRSETCRKMTETISSDSTIDDSERKTLTELVGKLAE